MAVDWFDVIGVVVVGGWLVLAGSYVYRHEAGRNPELDDSARELSIRDGDDWLLLRRDGDEVGFVHRARTRVEKGWLVEYDLLVVLEIFERNVPIETSIRAELDEEGFLREFDAEVRGAGESLDARGDVRGSTLSVVVRSDSTPRRRELPLEHRPRLKSNAAHQLLARGELEVGDRIADRYFDPTALGFETIALEYRGRRQIELEGRTRRAHHVRQQFDGSEYSIYLDDRGRVLRQEHPMGIVGDRVSGDQGRSRADALRKEARKLRRRFTAGDAVGRSLETALDMLGFGVASESTSPGGNLDADAGSSSPPDAAPSDRPEVSP